MASEAQQQSFLGDVEGAAQWWCNKSLTAPLSLTPPSWPDLQLLAQQAAVAAHPDGECPVWASDVDLTAEHLARRKGSMEPDQLEVYATIVHEIGRRYVEANPDDTLQLWPDDLDDAVSLHTDDELADTDANDVSVVFDEDMFNGLDQVKPADLSPVFSSAETHC
jgi:hypothetical protein